MTRQSWDCSEKLMLIGCSTDLWTSKLILYQTSGFCTALTLDSLVLYICTPCLYISCAPCRLLNKPLTFDFLPCCIPECYRQNWDRHHMAWILSCFLLYIIYMSGKIMISSHFTLYRSIDDDSMRVSNWAGKVLEPQSKQFLNSRNIYGMQNA